MSVDIKGLIAAVEGISPYRIEGKVSSVTGLMLKADGIHPFVSIGSRCVVINRFRQEVRCEVIGFGHRQTFLMPFSHLDGIGPGCKVIIENEQPCMHPHDSWKGRVINALGEPIDGKGPLTLGGKAYPLKATALPAHKRRRVMNKIDLGVRAMNTFLSCCKGQRMGIFAGSGVGKSMLVSMLTRYAACDVKVIGLIGERGREVQEFLEEYLGPEGLKEAVVVVATSDESPLLRKQAAYTTLTVAEYFRDRGSNVLCLMDSVTRFAMAQREIGLTVGEPPTTKGYTPTVFAELPKLLERAGPGIEGIGDITGLFSVLVEGDDHNEPVSDAVRGILDGHIVLNRNIAMRGRYPAIDILKSVSRTMPGCNTDAENQLVKYARNMLATYENMAEMIRLGAYRKGSDPDVDKAILYYPKLEAFLHQDPKERSTLQEGYSQLAEILDLPGWQGSQQSAIGQESIDALKEELEKITRE
ncbi:MAG: flagellar protein export ATPase FliI [Alphaproteobacteria bacterium]|nr:flagellar protein export ATPase FliI [Alphaproteobacteria bacterium]